jgi:hypothetical protein
MDTKRRHAQKERPAPRRASVDSRRSRERPRLHRVSRATQPCASENFGSESVDYPQLLVRRHACVPFPSWTDVARAMPGQFDCCLRSVGVRDPGGQSGQLDLDHRWTRDHYLRHNWATYADRARSGSQMCEQMSVSARHDDSVMRNDSHLWPRSNPQADAYIGRHRDSSSDSHTYVCGSRAAGQFAQPQGQHNRCRHHRNESLPHHGPVLSMIYSLSPYRRLIFRLLPI